MAAVTGSRAQWMDEKAAGFSATTAPGAVKQKASTGPDPQDPAIHTSGTTRTGPRGGCCGGHCQRRSRPAPWTTTSWRRSGNTARPNYWGRRRITAANTTGARRRCRDWVAGECRLDCRDAASHATGRPPTEDSQHPQSMRQAVAGVAVPEELPPMQSSRVLLSFCCK